MKARKPSQPCCKSNQQRLRKHVILIQSQTEHLYAYNATCLLIGIVNV